MKDVCKALRKPGDNLRIGSCFLFIYLISGGGLHAETITWGVKNNPFRFHRLENLTLETDRNGLQQLSLRRFEQPLDPDALNETLELNFNHLPESHGNQISKEDALSRSIRGGALIKGYYRSIRFPDSLDTAVSFEQPQHQIWIDPPEYLFLNRSDYLGDFSVFFMVRPYQLKQQMEIFRKVGLFEGRRQGVRCHIRNGRLNFEFLNLFSLGDKVLEKSTITTADPLVTNRFQKVLLQYRSAEGSLTLYLDGKEQVRRYVTATGEPGGTIYNGAFHPWDRSPLIIGKNYLGALDEMIFSNSILQPDANTGSFGVTRAVEGGYRQPSGVAVSEIFEMPRSTSQILSFRSRSAVPNGASLRFFYRLSDRPFPPDLGEHILPFRPLADKMGSGRYLQWKAKMYADPTGQSTPVISGMELIYRDNPAPQAPRQLEVAVAENNRVVLRFLRNAEMDVINGGRYKIYYGIRPDEPLGVIRYKKILLQPGGKLLPLPITDKDRLFTRDMRYQNRIQVTIDNNLISEHIQFTSDKPFLKFPYPMLKNGVPYYFWVTACDNAYRESPEYSDHESAPSEAVVARPEDPQSYGSDD